MRIFKRSKGATAVRDLQSRSPGYKPVPDAAQPMQVSISRTHSPPAKPPARRDFIIDTAFGRSFKLGFTFFESFFIIPPRTMGEAAATGALIKGY
jgi:hypothetical protein